MIICNNIHQKQNVAEAAAKVDREVVRVRASTESQISSLEKELEELQKQLIERRWREMEMRAAEELDERSMIAMSTVEVALCKIGYRLKTLSKRCTQTRFQQ